jgi:diguanylate cyclase (GGDEF)-like protein/PAS domain S-box-containing protein
MVQSLDPGIARLLEDIRDAAIVVDARDGQIVLWNESATAIFGYPAIDALGRSIDSIVVDLRRDLLRAPTAAASGEPQPPAGRGTHVEDGRMLELRAERADGFELRVEVTLSELTAGIGSAPLVLIIARDVTMRRVLEQRTVQAFRDPLTGLPNRALFLDRLEQALLRDDRAVGSVALLFLDLDRFKIINDSLGHQTGDRLLVAASKRIQGCLRAEDTASRLGGDEFTVLLEGIHDVREAVGIAERISDELDEPFQLGEHEIYISASIGIAMATDRDTLPDDLLRDADVAMYRAKRQGKARYVVFDPSMNAHALERLRLEYELRRAVEQQEFVVHYLPVVRLSTGRIQTLEALVRWQHPRRGLLDPEAFLPVAEEMGLSGAIGRWVLWEACALGASLRERFDDVSNPVVTINLTARQFHQPSLAEDIEHALRGARLPPSALGLEVTESVMMEDVQATNSALQTLKGLGVTLAIDDFGTGFSSLAYLRSFPVNFLKIDETFVAGLGRKLDDEVIVAAMIGLAHALDYTVIAEGVERVDQVERLKHMGCDVAQGSYFTEPLPAAEVPTLYGRDLLQGASDPTEGRVALLRSDQVDPGTDSGARSA